MMSSLKLRKRQKIALCGVFSLGLITICISLSRFLVYTITDYNVDDATGSKWTCKILLSRPFLTCPRSLVYRRNVHSNHRRLITSHEGFDCSRYAKQQLVSPQYRRLPSTSGLQACQQPRCLEISCPRRQNQRR
jgi:hypothetical protein